MTSIYILVIFRHAISNRGLTTHEMCSFVTNMDNGLPRKKKKKKVKRASKDRTQDHTHYRQQPVKSNSSTSSPLFLIPKRLHCSFRVSASLSPFVVKKTNLTVCKYLLRIKSPFFSDSFKLLPLSSRRNHSRHWYEIILYHSIS